jgi:hypothetical protein
MTAAHPGEQPALPRPACTPAAIRAVLAAYAGAGMLARYDADLDAAFVNRPALAATSLPCSRQSAAGGSTPTPGAIPQPTARI